MDINKWHEGLEKCIQNIIRLKEDGDMLLSRGSLGHAYFMYYTALEEMAKANFIIDRFQTPSPKQLRKIHFSHKDKIALMAGKIFLPDCADLPEMIAVLKETCGKNYKFGSVPKLRSKEFKLSEKIERRKNLLYWRERSIYVELNENNSDFLIPNEIDKDIILYNLKIEEMSNPIKTLLVLYSYHHKNTEK